MATARYHVVMLFYRSGLIKDKETISSDEYGGEENISSVDPDPPGDVSEPIEP